MRQNKLRVLVLGLLLTALLAGCGGNGAEQWTTYESELWGVAFEMPSQWVVSDEGDGVYVADSQDNLETDIFQDGGGIVITTSPLMDLGGLDDPVTLIDFFSEFIAGAGSDMSVLKETAQLTIKGQPAATTTLQGRMEGQEGYYTITVIVGEETVVLSIAVDTTADNAFEATIDRITKSITF